MNKNKKTGLWTKMVRCQCKYKYYMWLKNDKFISDGENVCPGCGASFSTFETVIARQILLPCGPFDLFTKHIGWEEKIISRESK